ncbi:MAG: PorT family protein, partial [Chloroflexi bacterium]|nr:PorT family protein [Chloroflexota bacterium]
TFVISAKMIDVVTGEIVYQASSEQKGSIDVVLEVARTVGKQISGQKVVVAEKPAAAREPVKVEEEQPAEKPPAEEKPPKEPEKPAAPAEPERIVFGVRGGVNMANVASTTDNWYFLYTDTSDTLGSYPYSTMLITAGAYFELNMDRSLALDIEVLFSQKGYDYDFIDYWLNAITGSYENMGSMYNHWIFNYIEVPILVKLRLPGGVSPYVTIGTSVAYLISGTVESIYENTYYQGIHDSTSIYGNPIDIYDLPFAWETFDAGLVIGAGIDISLGSLLLNLDARYTMGLLSISGDFDLTNSAITVTAGLGFQR